MTDPIVAWRYWWIPVPYFDFDVGGWVGVLEGDREVWDGPLKVAGTHRMDPHAHLTFNVQQLGRGFYAVDDLLKREHESPQRGCLCGVNAVRRLRSRDLTERHSRLVAKTDWWVGTPNPKEPSRAGLAFAQVDLGGTVDEYEQGYRAEQALIAGPIYVIRPPQVATALDWRPLIERRYGQPVIEQSYEEALDWIRKDEENNGHREAHQDTRVGTPAGTGTVGALWPASAFTVGTGSRTGAGAFDRAIAAQWAALNGAYRTGSGAVNALGAGDTGTGKGTRPRLTTRLHRWWRNNRDNLWAAAICVLAAIGIATLFMLATGIATVRTVP